MNAWSEYLRRQAAMADRLSDETTAPGIIMEFADIAVSLRRDADAEDANPYMDRRQMKFSGKNADRLLFLTLILIGIATMYVVSS